MDKVLALKHRNQSSDPQNPQNVGQTCQPDLGAEESETGGCSEQTS